MSDKKKVKPVVVKPKQEVKTALVPKEPKDRLVVEVVKGAPQFLTDTQIKRISIPTPKQFIKQREGKGGKIFDYVDTSYIISTLNGLFGFFWEFDILDESPITEAMQFESVRVRGKLTVKDKQGNSISKTNYGSQPMVFKQGAKHEPLNLSTELGDLYKSASSDCLKKCSSMFGISLDVYSGETNLERVAKSNKSAEVKKEEPKPDDGKWHLSEQQRKFLFALCKSEKGWDSKKADVEIHKQIKELFQKEHLADLTYDEYEYILRGIAPDKIKQQEQPSAENKKEKEDDFGDIDA